MEGCVVGWPGVGWPEMGRLEQVCAVLFAGYNAGYFLRYLYRNRGDSAASRLGALALALLFIGAVAEGVALLALSGRSSPLAHPVAPAWLLAHLLSVAAFGFVSLLVWRRGA